MAKKKNTEAAELLDSLLEFGNNNVTCDCSEVLRPVLGSFGMAEIVKRSSYFLNPVVFAVEYVKKGSRIFLTTSYEHFPHYFMKMREKNSVINYQTWHEILLECQEVRLYLDLEFYFTTQNRDVNAESLMGDLKCNFLEFLETEFKNVSVNIFELDATTVQKFSRHWIIHGPTLKNTKHAGEIIRRFSANHRNEFTVMEKSDNKLTSIIDQSVYSIGQNLRMLGSPKFGRENTLLHMSMKTESSHEFQFHGDCKSCEEVLLNSLVTCESLKSKLYWESVELTAEHTTTLKAVENCDSERAKLYAIFAFIQKLKGDNDVGILGKITVFANSHIEFVSDAKAILRTAVGFLTELQKADRDYNKLQYKAAEMLSILAENGRAGEKAFNDTKRTENDDVTAEMECIKLSGKAKKNLAAFENMLLKQGQNVEDKPMSEKFYGRFKNSLPSALQREFPIEYERNKIREKLEELSLDANSKRMKRFSTRKTAVENQIGLLLDTIKQEMEFQCSILEENDEVLQQLCQEQSGRILRNCVYMLKDKLEKLPQAIRESMGEFIHTELLHIYNKWKLTHKCDEVVEVLGKLL